MIRSFLVLLIIGMLPLDGNTQVHGQGPRHNEGNGSPAIDNHSKVRGCGTNPLNGGGGGLGGDLGIITDPKPYYENISQNNESRVEWVYRHTDTLGITRHYGSYDQTKELARFQPIGFVFTLLFFSLYLYYISEKMINQHFAREIANNFFYIFFYFISFILIVGWFDIVVLVKGLPPPFIVYDIFYYPSQFILGIVLSNFLLLVVGLFKFILVAFISNSRNNKTIIKDRRFSIVAIIFGVLGVIANILTVWAALK